MTQPNSSSRLSNLSLNIIGADGSIANYGNTGIYETSNFDISANGTLTLGSAGNVNIGNANGTVNITNGTVNLNTINGPTGGSTLRIGGNLVAGNIFLGATAGSIITVGGTGSRIILGTTGSTGIINGTFFANGNLVANTIVSSDANTPMTIGGNIGNSTIKIGEFTTGASAAVSIGNVTGTSSGALYGSTIQIGNASSTVNVGAAGSDINVGLTSNTVTIGGANTAVVINNGNTGTIQIGTAMRAGTISIGDTSFPTGIFASTLTLGGAGSSVVVGENTSKIFIGASGSTAYINGTVFLGASGSGNVTIGQGLTGSVTINSNSLNIGVGSTGSTGAFGVINIGNTGTRSTNSIVNIGIGATGVNIGTGSTGAVTIGSVGGITKFNGPLTLGSAPTSGTSAFLGSYNNNGYIAAITNMVSGTNYISNTITLPAGTYMGFLKFVPVYSGSGSTTFTNFTFSMTGTSLTNIIDYNDGNTTRPTMVFGNGSTYPTISLGPILFSVSALTTNIQYQVVPTFTFSIASAGIGINNSPCSYLRIA